MPKTALQLTILLTAVYAAHGQCSPNLSGLLDQVTTNSSQSLAALHDYVWIVEEYGTRNDSKGKIQKWAYRGQNVVANGKMYTRTLKPGEEPILPESEGALSAQYRVVPFECDGQPCMYPFAFGIAITLRDVWNVRQVEEGEWQGRKMLVIDLQAKHWPHHGYRPITAMAWVDPESCRLVRLQTTSTKPNGQDRTEEVFEFGEIKGNWMPVRREKRGQDRGQFVEWAQEYTYLRFGSTTRMVP